MPISRTLVDALQVPITIQQRAARFDQEEVQRAARLAAVRLVWIERQPAEGVPNA